MPIEPNSRSRAGRKISRPKAEFKISSSPIAEKRKAQHPLFYTGLDKGVLEDKVYVVDTESATNLLAKRFGITKFLRTGSKEALVKVLFGPGESVRLHDAGPDIEQLSSTLKGVQKQVAAFSGSSSSRSREKTAEERTVAWLAAEADRLRTVVAARVEVDRAHQRAMRAAVQALKKGL